MSPPQDPNSVLARDYSDSLFQFQRLLGSTRQTSSPVLDRLWGLTAPSTRLEQGTTRIPCPRSRFCNRLLSRENRATKLSSSPAKEARAK